ncbi:MAG: c-type cytochrome [Archangium sp.]
MNHKHPSVLLARTASLSLVLALSACSERQEKAPSTSGVTSVAPQGNPTLANGARTPEQLFATLGCPACHAPGAPYASVLADARGKPPEVVAMWILDPQKVRPGTLMPVFKDRLSTDEALALAKWLQAGNPAPALSP